MMNEYSQIKNVCRQIRSGAYSYISFDLFDTLVTRPFYRPEDLYYLMDREFEKDSDSSISFHKIRTDGEKAARKKAAAEYPDFQDITQAEIYEYIAETFGIDRRLAESMCSLENRLELRCSFVRNTGKYLFDYALACGRKIVIVSDTFLPGQTVRAILSSHGYEGYDRLFLSAEERKLKSKGALFDTVLKELGVDGNAVLHIGDNWKSDICQAKSRGIRTFHLPKPMDAFENRNGNYEGGSCAAYARKACGALIDYQKAADSAGYGAMTALVANKFLDNPFSGLGENTGYKKSPYFIGYYMVGMHILGIADWIRKSACARKRRRVLFTSRDGYLPMAAYRILKDVYKDMPEAEYLYISRRAMLPFMVSEPIDFFDLPIDVKRYSPDKMMELLEWCIYDKQRAVSELHGLWKKDTEKNFSSIYEYHCFVRLFLDNWYDAAAHRSAQESVTGYLSGIAETDILFDMGYSGRIQGAVCKALGRKIDVLYVHSDEERHYLQERRGRFEIGEFYQFTPIMSDVLREYIFSENAPSCIGYMEDRGRIVPVFEKDNRNQDKNLIRLQKGAMDFVRDFCGIFGKDMDFIPYKSFEVSLPFEGFLRFAEEEWDIFEDSVFEDEVYAAEKSMSVEELTRNRLYRLDKKVYKREFEKKEAFSKLFQRIGRQIVLWGTGSVAEKILEFYGELPVGGLVSEKRELQGKRKWGLEIWPPEKLADRDDVYVIIAARDDGHAVSWLEENGYCENRDYVSFDQIFAL